MIIVEIGLNHMGRNEFVDRYLDKLSETKADAITMQVREPEFYESNWNGYNLALSNSTYTNFVERARLCDKKAGIAIGDVEYLPFFESIGVDFYKVIRNDITNLSLIDALASTQKEIIVSTGLSSEEDIDGFSEYINSAPHIKKPELFKLNHTQLSYDVKDCNLNALRRMKERYDLDVSFGSHCENHNVLYMSLCYCPSDILFYVKINEPSIKFPDDKHAVFLENINVVVNNLKALSQALGDEKKIKMSNRIRG